MTQYPELFAMLAAPFRPEEVKLRQAPGGRQLHYITARTAMIRLDEVVGPENWWDLYQPLENSVVCMLSVRLPDGQIVTKCDAGGYAGMADQGDDDKSGFSDGFKRACAKFGVGRYLYRDGVPNFVKERVPATEHPPEAASVDRPGSQPQQGRSRQEGGGSGGAVPRTGKALFAWTKDQEQRHEVGLLKYINGWAKLQDFSARMIDWDADQVASAHREMVRKIQSIEPHRNEGLEEALAD